MKNKLFLSIDPALLESMIKTNVHPYVYMAKYATRHFLELKDVTEHKFAMTFTSSLAAMVWMPNFAAYAGTKAHNYMLAKMLNQALFKSEKTRNLVDLQSLHPAGVSTNLNKFKRVEGQCVSA